MMQIHTTQNLNSFGRLKSTNTQTIPNKEIRLDNTNQPLNMPNDKVSFKGKKELVEKGIKKAKEVAKKQGLFAKIIAKINDSIDKMMYSDKFNKVLDMMSHGVMVQAAISFIVCACLRPLTIMTVLAKKDKEDNIYASAHSISSGLVGFIASFLIATPFSKGVKFLQQKGFQNLSEQTLKKLFPHLDTKTIWQDAAKKIRKPIKDIDDLDWKDIYGNKFIPDLKKAQLISKPKHISEVSESTFKTIGIDIDLAAMKNKPVSEWVDKQGNKLHLNIEDMFVAVKEDGLGTNYFSLKLMDKNFLKEVFPKVDMKTIEKEGNRLHPDLWKNVDGSKFKLNPESIHISSYRETTEAVPFYTGAKRTIKNTGEQKYISYQPNGLSKKGTEIPIKEGTPLLQEYLDADKKNDIMYKLLVWLPDIITRPAVATSTIALIPIILKKVFHIEKKKTNQIQEQQAINTNNNATRKVVA